MQAIYGWDVACDLQPESPYDEVVTVSVVRANRLPTRSDIGTALDRAFASRVPDPVTWSPTQRRLPENQQPRLIHPSVSCIRVFREGPTPTKHSDAANTRMSGMDGRQDGETVSASVQSPRSTRTTSWPFLRRASTPPP